MGVKPLQGKGSLSVWSDDMDLCIHGNEHRRDIPAVGGMAFPRFSAASGCPETT